MNGATGERSGFDLDAIGPRRGASIDYAAGTAWALGEAGIQMHNLRGVIVSSLPTGSSLSSSAALELAAAWALADLPGGGIPALQLARICQRAENVHERREGMIFVLPLRSRQEIKVAGWRRSFGLWQGATKEHSPSTL